MKTVDSISEAHIGQVLNYLRLLNATRAKIINFRNQTVETKFVNCSDTIAQRRFFEVDLTEYRGPPALSDTLTEMLRDIGTRLSNSLYTECLVSNVGWTEAKRIWADRNVFQKFNLVADDEAFIVTSMKTGLCGYRTHLSRMRQTARLKQFDWINVTPSVVRVESVR